MILNDQEVIEYYGKKGPGALSGQTYGLIGSLGSGKTYLVMNLLTRFAPDFGKQVHSPTFNLCNIYQWADIEVHHYDLYRLQSAEDLYDIGVMESIGNKLIVTFIEWVDLFPELSDCCDEIITITEDNSMNRQYQIDQLTPKNQ